MAVAVIAVCKRRQAGGQKQGQRWGCGGGGGGVAAAAGAAAARAVVAVVAAIAGGEREARGESGDWGSTYTTW